MALCDMNDILPLRRPRILREPLQLLCDMASPVLFERDLRAISFESERRTSSVLHAETDKIHDANHHLLHSIWDGKLLEPWIWFRNCGFRCVVQVGHISSIHEIALRCCSVHLK